MRIGQTSFVVFGSTLLSSVFGFVATVYFARVLGPEVYGIYAIIVAVTAWLKLFGDLGISNAVTKRISEGAEQGAYMAAGGLLLATFAFVVTIGLVLGQEFINSYISDWEAYVEFSVVWFIIGLLLAWLAATFVLQVLHGQNLVHIAGMLEPVKTGLRSALQLGLVFLGFHLAGMIIGYIIGVTIAAIIGTLFVTIKLQRPRRRHIVSLYDYAKYSWLGGLKSRTYQDVDIIILAALVPIALVGIYAIAWSFIKLLKLFGKAVSSAVFPEISYLSTQESLDATSGFIEDAITYGGFIAIPGAIGGTLLAERLLLIHGPEYVPGTEVLWLMLFGVIFWAYMRQCLNALNALDRPDLSFRVNLIFVASNVILNILLILEFGWVGAAIASLLSTCCGFLIAYAFLKRIVDIRFPLREVGNQATAAVVMGAVILPVDQILRSTEILPFNVVGLLLLVPLGATIYIVTVFALSPSFRTIIERNLPHRIGRLI